MHGQRTPTTGTADATAARQTGRRSLTCLAQRHNPHGRRPCCSEAPHSEAQRVRALSAASRMRHGHAAPGEPVPAVVQAWQRRPVGSGMCSASSRAHSSGIEDRASANGTGCLGWPTVSPPSAAVCAVFVCGARVARALGAGGSGRPGRRRVSSVLSSTLAACVGPHVDMGGRRCGAGGSRAADVGLRRGPVVGGPVLRSRCPARSTATIVRMCGSGRCRRYRAGR